MSSVRNTAILVAERDGDWSEWVEPLRGQAEDIAIVIQRMDESPAELAARVRERVEAIAREGELVAAALVGGERWDGETLSARSSMVQALVSHMRGPDSELFLDAGPSRGRGRHAMQAIASVLSEQVDDSLSIVTTRGPLPTPRRSTRRAA